VTLRPSSEGVYLCAYEYESTYLVGHALREASCNMTAPIA